MPTELPPGAELGWEWWNPLIVLLVVGLAILGIGILFGQTQVASRRNRTRTNTPSPRPDSMGGPVRRRTQGTLGNGMGRDDQGPARTSTDRRTSMRRKGKAVRVLVATDGAREEVLHAWVTDRSQSGVCIVACREFAPGTALEIRAIDAPDTVPWVEVEVKGCRRKGNRWTLGCQFKQELPWSVLLLFG